MKPPEDCTQQSVREIVRAGYAAVATGKRRSCCGPGPNSPSDHESPIQVAERIGYAPEDLDKVPDGANMGLSCGNPTALASLKMGETVLDLGSGGGLDCFIAGPRVGQTGRVIGVDMTPEMITRARQGIDRYRSRTGLDNVEFRLGEIEHLPVADSIVDVVISNCVLNLSPDKPRAWREIARVLKPGGRVAVSDLALLRSMPQNVREMVEALVGCITGAVPIDDTKGMMQEAGLIEIRVAPVPGYFKALEEVQDPLYQRIVPMLPTGSTMGDFVTSVGITARKSGNETPTRPATMDRCHS